MNQPDQCAETWKRMTNGPGLYAAWLLAAAAFLSLLLAAALLIHLVHLVAARLIAPHVLAAGLFLGVFHWAVLR